MYDYFWEIVYHLAALLLAPNSVFSIGSLFCAFIVATGFLIWKRHQRGKELKFNVLLRALFRKQQLMSASHRVDIAFAILNTTVLATVIGVAIFSFNAVSPAFSTWVVASGLRLSESCCAATTSRKRKELPDADRV